MPLLYCMSKAVLINEINYLVDPAVAAYFDVEEHMFYYRWLKYEGPRLDFHSRLIPILESFINLVEDESNADKIDIIIKSKQINYEFNSEGSPLEIASALHPEGVALLELSEPLSFDSLKDAYRVAAKKNHPDMGGNHSAMIAINEVYPLLHNLLSERENISDTFIPFINKHGPQDCSEYRYKCALLLFQALVDDLNLDTSFMWLQRILSNEWHVSSYANIFAFSLCEWACKLATYLAIAHNEPDAIKVINIVRKFHQVNPRLTKYKHTASWFSKAKAAINGTKSVKIMIQNPRQAQNALRLGLIDQKRYEKACQGDEIFKDNQRLYEEKLRVYIKEKGFLQNLPTDVVALGKVMKNKLVPEPDALSDIIMDITDDQQAEYLCAFSDSATLPLVWKYTRTRLHSLLESVVFYPSSVDATIAEGEARILFDLNIVRSGRNGSGLSVARLAQSVVDIIAKLSDHDPDERSERDNLLRAIVERLRQEDEYFRATDKRYNILREFATLVKDWDKIIILPLEDLRRIIENDCQTIKRWPHRKDSIQEPIEDNS